MKLTLRPTSPSEEAMFSDLLAEDIEDIYRRFGLKVGDLDSEESPEEGAKRWIVERRAELHKIVCVDGRYCQFAEAAGSARVVDIAAALSDLLAAHYGAMPVSQLTVLLLRGGLGAFCDC